MVEIGRECVKTRAPFWGVNFSHVDAISGDLSHRIHLLAIEARKSLHPPYRSGATAGARSRARYPGSARRARSTQRHAAPTILFLGGWQPAVHGGGNQLMTRLGRMNVTARGI